ncbi:flavin monoamine oxidase family protein [Nocardia cyriacigeorgica]|uniref:flavin monoamine oxidase family protein n=1 Tax=Nocardia cyriacigeorgica TaxID=135487 RepID=UPI0013D7ADEA|nr:FAD-dependent oxidoreductase [Nocardia cyriacigeorgica]NEW26078.1 FAD-dependent oxidoreductase [Nocardia cyriacigeorgica]
MDDNSVQASRERTVVVVGAGLAGLTAARILHQRGTDVIMLEAADRIGGRAMSATTMLDSRVDLGGQWIGHDHHRITAVAAEFGLTPFPMHTGPLPAVVTGARRLSPVGPSMLTAGLVLAGVELLARIGAPARCNDSTVEQWLRRVPGRTARRLLEVIAEVSWTADLDRISVQAMTKMIRAQGGLRTIMSTAGGAQEFLLTEGVGALVDGLAAELGVRVRCGQPVTSVERGDRGITVRTPDDEIRAAKVIVTVPAPMQRHITFTPALPPSRIALTQNTYMGSVYKAIAVYERPFWRSRHGGEFIQLDNPGSAVFDTSPPGGPGHLCVLAAGPRARDLDHLDPADRRTTILGPLIPHIGPEVTEPVDWHEKSWHRDQYAGGGYVALPEPGTTDGFPPFPATPVGDIHWAGTETADGHAGYLDGAIESGTRAAHEVLTALNDRDSVGR